MKRLILTLLALPGFITSTAFAQEYVAIEMEIDVDKPAAEVWSKVGGYCDISEWLGLHARSLQVMAL